MTSRQESTLRLYVDALTTILKPHRIRTGGTKTTRAQVHVFAPGGLYGGKLGSLLCKKPYRQILPIAELPKLESDICPGCRNKLKEIARILIARGEQTNHLFERPNGKIDPFSGEDVMAAFAVLIERQKALLNQPVQTTVVDMEEARQPVRMTLLWTPPVPSQP